MITQKRFFEVATVVAMRAIPYSVYNWECRLLDVTMAGDYRWDKNGVEADDGYNVIRCDQFASFGKGVWKRWNG